MVLKLFIQLESVYSYFCLFIFFRVWRFNYFWFFRQVFYFWFLRQFYYLWCRPNRGQQFRRNGLRQGWIALSHAFSQKAHAIRREPAPFFPSCWVLDPFGGGGTRLFTPCMLFNTTFQLGDVSPLGQLVAHISQQPLMLSRCSKIHKKNHNSLSLN